MARLNDHWFQQAKVCCKILLLNTHVRPASSSRCSFNVQSPWQRCVTCMFLLQAQGYVARSAFKLEEIQERFGVIKKGVHCLADS